MSALLFVLGKCAPVLHDDPMPERRGRWYAIPAPERDRMILALRRRGYTFKHIGKRVGMSESGVRRAIQHIREGGFGEGMARN